MANDVDAQTFVTAINGLAAQIAPEIARQRATYVIENDGDFGHLRDRTRQLYELLAQA